MKRSVFVVVIFFLSFSLSCKKDNPSSPDPDPPTQTISTVPYVIINTNGNTIVDEPKVSAEMRVVVENIQVFSNPIGIELRGSTSRRIFDKLSYGFESWDNSGEDVDVSILGLPEEEDWILYGPYSDKTFLRNVIIYDLAREMGQYASRGHLVELEINEAYLGVYVLMEKLKRDNNRLDLTDLSVDENSPEEVTGGYILKIDKTAGDSDNEDWAGDEEYTSTISFRSDYGAFWNELSYAAYGPKQGEETYYIYEDPKAEDISSQQKNYIKGFIDGFETAIFNDDFALAYQDFINLDSFVDYFLLNELSGNPDAYRLSTYLHKDRDGKLNMGPIWDFNIAFGNDGRSTTEGWVYLYNENYPEDLWLIPFYWEKLTQNDTFQQAVQSRWNELKTTTLSAANIHAMIDAYIAELEDGDAINRNYQKWDVLGEQLPFNSYIGETYQDEVDYLKGWITARINWLDSAIPQLGSN